MSPVTRRGRPSGLAWNRQRAAADTVEAGHHMRGNTRRPGPVIYTKYTLSVDPLLQPFK